MKTIWSLVLVATFATAQAQDVFSNKTNFALEKVLQDFPNQFKNITGSPLGAVGANGTYYRSIIQVPGTACTVTRHQIGNNEAYSWQCVALENKDFNLARNKFKEIFDQIQNTIVKVEGDKPFIVSGQYSSPQPDLRATVIHFDLLPAVGEMQKVGVDLILQNASSIWRVDLKVYDHAVPSDMSTAINN